MSDPITLKGYHRLVGYFRSGNHGGTQQPQCPRASGQGTQEAYTQITGDGTDDKVVYTVAGNGGWGYVQEPELSASGNPFGQLALGSVVIDLDSNHLEASFVDVNGAVLDASLS